MNGQHVKQGILFRACSWPTPLLRHALPQLSLSWFLPCAAHYSLLHLVSMSDEEVTSKSGFIICISRYLKKTPMLFLMRINSHCFFSCLLHSTSWFNTVDVKYAIAHTLLGKATPTPCSSLRSILDPNYFRLVYIHDILLLSCSTWKLRRLLSIQSQSSLSDL